MTRVSASLLSVLAAALWPAQGQAQAGPSFNCADSDTASEVAICGSPELSQLELQMFASYLRLVDAVGERRARNIADRFLERRQACGADEACIAERLRISMRVFERRAGGDTQLAGREPSEDELTGREAPSEEVATIEAPAAASPIEAPVEEELAAIPTPPVRPERFAFLEPEPSIMEDDLALAEPAPLAEEELALAPEPISPVEEEPALIEEPVPVEEPSLIEEPAPVEEPAPIEADVAASEPPEAALPEEEIASAEPIDPDLPLAAQAPLPSDLDPLLEDEAVETVPDDASTDIASAEPSSEEASAEPASPALEAPLLSDLDPLVEDEALDTAPDDVSTDVASAEPLPSSEETIPEPAPSVETASAEPTSAEPVPSSGEISGAIDGADLASSDEPAEEPALFGSPVSWAFMDLGRAERAEIQARLQATGLYEGPAEGAWDQATLAAMETFLTSEEGGGFDSSTQTGASLALDFIRSDAYAEAHGLPPGEPEADPNDPLASTDW